MSEQICPNCNQMAFTWSIDEDISGFTLWYCSLCSFKAQEDESKECQCDSCGDKSLMYLKAGESNFWFCTTCQNKMVAETR